MLRKGQAVVERNSQEGPGGRALPLPTPKPNAPSQTLGSQESSLRAGGGSLTVLRLGRGWEEASPLFEPLLLVDFCAKCFPALSHVP